MRSMIIHFAILGLAIASPLNKEHQGISFNQMLSLLPLTSNLAATEGNGINAAVAIRAEPCAPNPVGNAIAITGQQDVEGTFKNYPDFNNAALNAETPVGFKLVSGFKNLRAAAQDPTYMGFTMPASSLGYATEQCGFLCERKIGCNTFNICKLICIYHLRFYINYAGSKITNVLQSFTLVGNLDALILQLRHISNVYFLERDSLRPRPQISFSGRKISASI